MKCHIFCLFLKGKNLTCGEFQPKNLPLLVTCIVCFVWRALATNPTGGKFKCNAFYLIVINRDLIYSARFLHFEMINTIEKKINICLYYQTSSIALLQEPRIQVKALTSEPRSESQFCFEILDDRTQDQRFPKR